MEQASARYPAGVWPFLSPTEQTAAIYQALRELDAKAAKTQSGTCGDDTQGPRKPRLAPRKLETGTAASATRNLMFTRTHQTGDYAYTEATQSYRTASQNKHRCIARWPAHRSLADELALAQQRVDQLRLDIAYWQDVIKRTIPPKPRSCPASAPRVLADLQHRLLRATARLAALQAASEGLAQNVRRATVAV